MKQVLSKFYKTENDKRISNYMLSLILVGLATALVSYQGVVRSYNSTMLALSYRYGFTSRSLLGTIYHILNRLIPADIMTYGAVVRFAQIVTALFFILIYIFVYSVLKSCPQESLKITQVICLLLVVSLVSTFSCGNNFLRVDLFMVAMALLSALVLMRDRCQWLVIVLSALGVMFHQGFVFMYFNVALVLLLYKAFKNEKKVRAKYLIMFLITFLLGSALFIWFELLSRSNGALYFDDIVNEARDLSKNGQYHLTLLYHEVLGIDLSESEVDFHKDNLIQIIIYTVLCMPYIVVTVRFFKNLIKEAKGGLNKFVYIIVAFGAGTMLPDFLWKVDYGRWIIAVMVYYMVVILTLISIGDELVCNSLNQEMDLIKTKPWAIIWMIMPVMIIPFLDVDINILMQHACTLFHWIFG